jgi:hypothetical protein
MRRESIAAVAAALCLALTSASARGLQWGQGEPAQLAHELRQAPGHGIGQFAPRHRQMAQQSMPASAAVAAVTQRYPAAKVLGVRRAPNGDFVVTIRLGNQVRRVRVDGGTGQIK